MSWEMSAIAAKLPISRKSGSAANWKLPRKSVTSVEAAPKEGSRPMNRDELITPTMPMIEAIGSSTSVISHMTMNTMMTVEPTCALTQYLMRSAFTTQTQAQTVM